MSEAASGPTAIAYRRLAKAGFEGLSTRDIAADVGVNVATLHYYFPTKVALVRALVGRTAYDAHEAARKLAVSRWPEIDAFIRETSSVRHRELRCWHSSNVTRRNAAAGSKRERQLPPIASCATWNAELAAGTPQ